MQIFEVISQERPFGHAAAIEYLKSLGDLSNIGISMTNIPRLGINPNSVVYDGPIGVYFYPADYYVSVNGELPMFSHNPYINIFSYGGNALDLGGTVSTESYKSLWQSLTKWPVLPGRENHIQNLQNPIYSIYFSLKNKFTFHHDVVASWVDQVTANDDEDEEFMGRLEGIHSAKTLWYLSWLTSKIHNPTKFTGTWNTLLKQMGYSVVLSNNGEISDYEEVQGVVLDPSVIKMIKTFENKVDSSNPTH